MRISYLLFASAACLVAGAPWEKIGPNNIVDDSDGQGFAGTLSDAVSPISNPSLIYAGGDNNGAASGVLKSTDGGKTWVPHCDGLADTRIGSLFIVDDAGDHVLAGTPSGVYETLDGGASWKVSPSSVGIGFVKSMFNGTINGQPHIIAGVVSGIVHRSVQEGGNWSLIESPDEINRYISVSDVFPNSVVASCIGPGYFGTVFIASITGPTTAVWKNTSLACMNAAIDPNNPDHILYSNHSSMGKESWETLDGGKTHHNLNNHFPYHVAIDRQGWLYTAAEAGAHRSMDGGLTWQDYQVTTTPRGRPTTNGSRIAMDYQRIMIDFAGGVAFTSDQGLFIKPEGSSLELASACGNMSNNIAISLAVSEGDGTNRYMVTTAWDWGPLASWDSGAHWPNWNCADCGTESGIGEGGYTRSMGRSNHVLMIHKYTVLYSSNGGKNFSRVTAPTTSFSPPVYTTLSNSRTEPDGRLFTIMAGKDGLKYVVKNSGFGAGPFDNKTGWVFGTALPANLTSCKLTTNPTDNSLIYAVDTNCVATSKDEGVTWSACWDVEYPVSSLLIKDSTTMFLQRPAQVPLRTLDAGKTWVPLDSFQPLLSAKFGMDLSWSGKTMMVSGIDSSKIAQGLKPAFSWRSTDDGDTFVDETDDLVSGHPGQTTWFDGTFYLSTSGQGILAKVFE